jgi:hypothetical protein
MAEMDAASDRPEHDPHSDARTLIQAEQIRRDKKRLKGVRVHAKTLHRSLGMGRGMGVRRRTRRVAKRG